MKKTLLKYNEQKFVKSHLASIQVVGFLHTHKKVLMLIQPKLLTTTHTE